MSRIVIAAAACTVLSTFAESNTLTGRPGFFQPTPDGNSSISRVVPIPEKAVAQPAPPPVTTPPEATPVVPATPAESEMDRIERENRERAARAAANVPVAPGAYNGLTDARDR